MIRALMWKEYREHRAIWVTLALVGTVGMYGLSRLLGPVWGFSYESVHESLRSLAVLLAWTYGLICGAMLLANEEETGTLMFLDILPARRIELWLAKCLFGMLLLLAQVAVLAVVVVVLGITETVGQFLATLLSMLVFGVFAMSWSLLFSARGQNVLNVIGLSFVGQIAGSVAATILLMPVAFVLAAMWGGRDTLPTFVVGCLGMLGLMIGPALGSARLFSRLDRERRGRLRLSNPSQATLPVWASWGRLVWLSYAQMRRFIVGILIFSLALGLLLLLTGPVGWPGLTLVVGVLCGVTVWSDEQLSASFRFLGDQRIPLPRVWIVKVGMRFALAVVAAIVLLLPSLIFALIHREKTDWPAQHVPFLSDLLHSNLVGPIVPVGVHLSLWLLYGFTVGQLSGLLFRKSMVAGVVALGVSGLLVCLWVPSLVGMGLHFWQVAGVPLALLAVGLLLMPAWTADRLLAPDTFVRLVLALLAATLWTAGGLWYRVAEIPNVPDQWDMPAYVASVPSLDPEQNPAGMAIHAAWGQVRLLSQELYQKRTGAPLFDELRQDGDQDTFSLEIDGVFSRGWPKRSSELGEWLDKQFQKEWHKQLAEAANEPLGAVENLKQMTVGDRLTIWGATTDPHRVLVVRGLQQQQTRGDHQAFVENLRISLALSRNLQHRAPPLTVNFGRQGELVGIGAPLDRWLERLPNEAELLQRTLDILRKHEAELPDASDAQKASYLIAQNSLEFVPNRLVEMQLPENVNRERSSTELRQAEVNAAAMLWRIPWEHERHQRILRLAFQGDPSQQRQAKKWGGPALTNLVPQLRPRRKRDFALLHAAQIKVALRLYQARNQGRLPATLDDLVPRYLPALPSDPFDGQPLRYRISKGEELDWFDEEPFPARHVPPGMGAAPGIAGPPAAGIPGMPPGQPAGVLEMPRPPVKTVPAGQAILWSVGEDGHDDGGKQQGVQVSMTSLGGDLIYLVPPPR